MATFKRISVSEFKTLTSSDFLDLIKSPKTGKLFLSNQNGDKFNVHQDIDAQGDCEILVIEDEGEISYCLVNKSVSAIRTF
jgi:hypothetical protein